MDSRAYEEGFGRLTFWSFMAYFFSVQFYWMAWHQNPILSSVAERQSAVGFALAWIAMIVGVLCLTVPYTAVIFFKYRAKVKHRRVLENQRVWCTLSYWMVICGGIVMLIAVAFNVQYWWGSSLDMIKGAFGSASAILSVLAIYLAPRQLRHDLRLIEVLLVNFQKIE